MSWMHPLWVSQLLPTLILTMELACLQVAIRKMPCDYNRMSYRFAGPQRAAQQNRAAVAAGVINIVRAFVRGEISAGDFAP